jgi:predicted short-subunit dehydrogenase-like oxidoreductase (DUF2520 family)
MTQASLPKQKPSISIIGPGRLGQALAIALRSRGYPIIALVGRSAGKARKVTTLLSRLPAFDKPAVALGSDQLERLPASDLILISTPDDAIEETGRRLAAKIVRTRRTTILHTSGALSSEVLSPLAELGFQTGSFHPLVSVSEPRTGAEALRGAFYCLEGDALAMRVARLIVSDLGGTSFSIKAEDKALYHAAAVMASPHLVAVFDLATQLLAACGLSRQKARNVLLPLVGSTVRNLRDSASEKALTGTFARGDLATVQRHLKALSRKELAGKLGDALEIYKLLGLHSLELAKNNGLDSEVVERIRKLLKSVNEKRTRAASSDHKV